LSILNDPFRRLRALLALVGIHSIAVGIGLMAHPASVFEFMGYARCSEPFFPTQGGVFHIVMAVGYLMAAADPSGNRCLITFAVVVKLLATAFLVFYWSAIDRIPVVLVSGVLDGLMGVLILAASVTWRRSLASEGN